MCHCGRVENKHHDWKKKLLHTHPVSLIHRVLKGTEHSAPFSSGLYLHRLVRNLSEHLRKINASTLVVGSWNTPL